LFYRFCNRPQDVGGSRENGTKKMIVEGKKRRWMGEQAHGRTDKQTRCVRNDHWSTTTTTTSILLLVRTELHRTDDDGGGGGSSGGPRVLHFGPYARRPMGTQTEPTDFKTVVSHTAPLIRYRRRATNADDKSHGS